MKDLMGVFVADRVLTEALFMGFFVAFESLTDDLIGVFIIDEFFTEDLLGVFF